jgi:hypothetical protein
MANDLGTGTIVIERDKTWAVAGLGYNIEEFLLVRLVVNVIRVL